LAARAVSVGSCAMVSDPVHACVEHWNESNVAARYDSVFLLAWLCSPCLSFTVGFGFGNPNLSSFGKGLMSLVFFFLLLTLGLVVFPPSHQPFAMAGHPLITATLHTLSVLFFCLAPTLSSSSSSSPFFSCFVLLLHVARRERAALTYSPPSKGSSNSNNSSRVASRGKTNQPNQTQPKALSFVETRLCTFTAAPPQRACGPWA
jgi:hypothetical protein